MEFVALSEFEGRCMRPAFDIGLVDFQIATMDQQDSRRVFGFLFVVQPAILQSSHIQLHNIAQLLSMSQGSILRTMGLALPAWIQF